MNIGSVTPVFTCFTALYILVAANMFSIMVKFSLIAVHETITTRNC